MKTEKMTDVEYLAHPGSWSRWPILPVVRNERPSVGIVVESSKGLLLFEGVNMFAALDNLEQAGALLLTPEQIVERGWRVD